MNAAGCAAFAAGCLAALAAGHGCARASSGHDMATKDVRPGPDTASESPPAGVPPVPPDSGLPGTGAAEPALVAELRAAYAAKPAGYVPRTHHRNDDGSPRYINRLIRRTSPYLLQHAHNPVNWFPWGDEAFDRARRLARPVLLSIGYSTCHWCHVMERESFEDLEIARVINELYVAIKVDREERPDVDDVYMKAVTMLTGRGGWPMTVVLTADREPFFGGTYFPARDGDRGARTGFLTILRELADRHRRDPEGVVAQARRVSERIRQVSTPGRPAAVPGPEAVEKAARALAAGYDRVHGGFRGAPKFPRPADYELLLRYHRRTSDPRALEIVTHSLERMSAGGIHDHAAGGFHRYSTDALWLVPHFEKMLYDNAQLAVLLLETHQAAGRPDFARTATRILDYVAREMSDPAGGFWSATDADSPVPGQAHEDEGWYFTWTPAEVEAAVGPGRARIVNAYFAVTPSGNFEGRSILHTPRPAGEVAADLGLTEAALGEVIDAVRPLLHAARSKRPPPGLDDKVLTSWNGLMISAFARGAFVLDRPDYADRAERAADFVLAALRRQGGRLLRTWKEGKASHPGYLDDYAFLVQGLLDLYESSFRPRWLAEALALQRTLDAHHGDPGGGGYFMTADDHEALLARDKPGYDGAEPSGNSVAAMNLLRLHALTGDEALRRRAEGVLSAFGEDLATGGAALPKMLSALDLYLDTPLEVAVVSPPGGAPPGALLAQLRRRYLPNRALAIAVEGPDLAGLQASMPWLDGKRALSGQPTAFVCERGLCERPTSDPQTLASQLAKVTPLHSDRSPPPLP